MPRLSVAKLERAHSESDVPPRDYAEQPEHWMELPEPPRTTSDMVFWYVMLVIALLGVGAAVTSLWLHLRQDG